jgi:5-methylcytosine-specific restriction endonuclease McrA
MRALGLNEIRRIDDPAHPRGYREWVGRKEKERRFKELLEASGEKRCFVCHGPFTHYNGPTLEHIIPKGAGGSTHDDHRDNLALSHWRCNVEKGSRRIA